MSCSKQEIEQKRLAAIQKRQNNIEKSKLNVNDVLSSPETCKIRQSGTSGAGPLRADVNTNSHKTFHPYTKPECSSKSDPIILSKVVSGTVYLISEERFEVNPSEFCTPLINIFKTIPSRAYGKTIMISI